MIARTGMVKQLVKWVGGKYDEYKAFKDYIPRFKNYYEPFFGGGGVFFALQPKGKCYLNDTSDDLIQFYKQLANPDFHKELWLYVKAWEQCGVLAKDVGKKLLPLVKEYLVGKISDTTVRETITDVLATTAYSVYDPLFTPSFIINKPLFVQHLKHTLHEKCRRLKISATRENSVMPENILQQIETAVHAAFYIHVRYLYNQYATKCSYDN